MSDRVLTLKQRRFVEEYVGPARGNATEAARLAGYSDPEVSGWENKQKQAIWAEIEQRLKARSLAASEVIERLTQHANATLAPFLAIGNGTVEIDLTSDDAQANIHLLKKAKCKRRTGGKDEHAWTETELEIELHDPQAAIVHIGRHYALFTDRSDSKVSIGGVIGYDITPPAGVGDSHDGKED